MNPILQLLMGRKALKSFRETSFPPDSQPLSPTMWAYLHVTPSPQSHAYCPPLRPWGSSSELRGGCPLACSPQQVLPIKCTLRSHIFGCVFFWLTRTPSRRPLQVTCCSHSQGRHLCFSPPVQLGHPGVYWQSPVKNHYSISQLLVKMWVLRRPVCDQDGSSCVLPRQKQWTFSSLAGRNWLELWSKPQGLV